MDTRPPAVSSGNVQQSAIAADEIKATTSIFDASLGARSNETSGIAIRERKMQGNIANFVYLDNLTRSIWFTGEVLVDLIPRIYDTQRQEMILGEDGKEEEVSINQEVVDEATGQTVLINDLSLGKYSVVVNVGPHYSTKRAETAYNLTELAGVVPRIGELGADIIISNLDFEGADEMANRLKKTLPPELTEDENTPVEPKPPTVDELLSKAKVEGEQLNNEEKKIDIAQKSIELQQFVKEVAQGAAAGAVQQTLTKLGLLPPESGAKQ